MLDRRLVLAGAVGATLGMPSVALAQSADSTAVPTWPPAESFPLWPGKAPGTPATLPVPAPSFDGYQGKELWLRGVAMPTVGVFRPERPDGRAVLSIPGGGYGFVSVSNEGIDVARVLNARGITVFVLAYRLPGEGWAKREDVPLQDAQRAMRLIRANATRYGIDPARLGTIGFSAGGHLAGMLAVGHADPVYTPVDHADHVSARPDFAGLIYAVTSFQTAGFDPAAPVNGLLGPKPSAASLDRYDPARRLDSSAPPLFLAHAMDDGVVPIAQSLLMLDRARVERVPVEAHLFQHGGHGFGALHLAAGSPGLHWPELFSRWSAALPRP